MSIPKKAYLYWGRNKPLSFMRWMTVKSFTHHNPDWLVDVYFPTRPSSVPIRGAELSEFENGLAVVDYFDKLETIRGVSVKEFEFNTIGVANNIPEAFKSDVLRWHLLSKYGGLWSDFDIIYIKPISNIGKADVVLCCIHIRDDLHCNSIGFLMSAPEPKRGWRFFSNVFKMGRESIRTGCYQKFMPIATDMFFDPSRDAAPDCVVRNLDKSVVYPIPGHLIERLYSLRADVQIAPETIGIHWYGNRKLSSAFEGRVTAETVIDCGGVVFAEMARVINETGGAE